MEGTEARILVVDNFDSFTYNLVHLLEQLDVDIEVKRNDSISVDEASFYTHILLSPGPGVPSEAGVCSQLIETYKYSRSILGVCLGMQCLLENSGARMNNLETVQHGAQELLVVDVETRLFHGLPKQIKVGRYHSWGFNENEVTSEYLITAKSEDGIVMAVAHKELPIYGVQFHPESIMTSHGLEMIRNWASN